MGEIDIIIAGALTGAPFIPQVIEGVETKLGSVAEIITKKVYHRGNEVQARDIFDIAAAARTHRDEIVDALREYPAQVSAPLERMNAQNPEFVARTIGQLMIKPGFEGLIETAYGTVLDLLQEVLKSVSGSKIDSPAASLVPAKRRFRSSHQQAIVQVPAAGPLPAGGPVPRADAA